MKLFAVENPMRRKLRLTLLLTFLVTLCSLAAADEQIIRVARISLIEGEVSYQRANDSKTDWFDATLNTPLGESDQLYSGNGRAELQLSGRNLIRIDHNTNLRVTQFNTATSQFALSIGTATFRIDSLDRRQFHVLDARDAGVNDPVYFEVDTPAVAITLLKEGSYRINVRDDGTTEVIVRRGAAEVYNQELGTIHVKQGRRIIVEGRDPGYYQIARLEDKDNWDRWNDRRDDDLVARVDRGRSVKYVPAALPGVYDLDDYGDWLDTPDYGYVWYPRSIAVGWAPYRSGYWRHYGGWGWTWVSSEPWGWVPYHYGRWAYYRSRWCWVPRIGVGLGFDWGWSPHLVTFFGSGGGYRNGYYDGYRNGYRDARYDWVGWCPLGPGENRRGRSNGPLRTLESYRNYGAPGGVNGLDGRRFEERRVMAENFTAPPRRGAGNVVERGNDRNNGNNNNNGGGGLAEIQTDLFKPTRNEVARNTPIARQTVSALERTMAERAVAAPVVMRRTPEAGFAGAPERNGSPIGAPRPNRDGQPATMPARGAPERNGDGQVIAPPRRDAPAGDNAGEGVPRPERPARAPEYRPVERSAPPVRRSGDDGSGRTAMPERNSAPERSERPERTERPERANPPQRDESPRPIYTPPVRESRPPSEERVEPRRSERPERVEPPSRPPVERREMPSRPERSERPQRNDPPPARESAPPRNSERPSPSMPERSAPPPRASAPAREARPERAPERSPERQMPERPARPERPERDPHFDGR